MAGFNKRFFDLFSFEQRECMGEMTDIFTNCRTECNLSDKTPEQLAVPFIEVNFETNLLTLYAEDGLIKLDEIQLQYVPAHYLCTEE